MGVCWGRLFGVRGWRTTLRNGSTRLGRQCAGPSVSLQPTLCHCTARAREVRDSENVYTFVYDSTNAVGNTVSDAFEAWAWEQASYNQTRATCAADGWCTDYSQMMFKSSVVFGCSAYLAPSPWQQTIRPTCTHSCATSTLPAPHPSPLPLPPPPSPPLQFSRTPAAPSPSTPQTTPLSPSRPGRPPFSPLAPSSLPSSASSLPHACYAPHQSCLYSQPVRLSTAHVTRQQAEGSGTEWECAGADCLEFGAGELLCGMAQHDWAGNVRVPPCHYNRPFVTVQLAPGKCVLRECVHICLRQHQCCGKHRLRCV